ncbi:MAG: Rrf2 family transcriptional regulator [Thermoguttaceae bacterium]|nr:Rrf2 family transcriptional regulator [Thermoguttaceae bacterium]
MLTKTTISAVRTLIYLGQRVSAAPSAPRLIAEELGESPTYLAKVTHLLARAGILRTQRGMAGGVVLHRRPEEVNLLAVVETCQGAVWSDFQDASSDDLEHGCAFHRAGVELQEAIAGILSRWTLACLLEKPCPSVKHLCERCLLMQRSFAVLKDGEKQDD